MGNCRLFIIQRVNVGLGKSEWSFCKFYKPKIVELIWILDIVPALLTRVMHVYSVRNDTNWKRVMAPLPCVLANDLYFSLYSVANDRACRYHHKYETSWHDEVQACACHLFQSLNRVKRRYLQNSIVENTSISYVFELLLNKSLVLKL